MERPSLEQVLAELQTLRKGQGLTYAKVRSTEHVPLLPAVLDTIERTSRHPDDRYAVATEFIVCVAESTKHMGADWSKLVCMALNINPKVEQLLSRREQHFYTVVRATGRKTYERDKKDAFTQLAGLLVGLLHSPCVVDADAEDEEAKRIQANALIETEYQFKKDANNAYEKFRRFKTPEEAEAELIRIVRSLPKLMQQYAPNRLPSLAVLKELMTRVLRTEYPKWVRYLDLHEELFPASVMQGAVSYLQRLGADLFDFMTVQTASFDWSALESEDSEEAQVQSRRAFLAEQRHTLAQSLSMILNILEVVERSGDIERLELPEDQSFSLELNLLLN